MQCPPTAKKLDLEHFTECFKDSMDESDMAAEIIPKVKKHIELNKRRNAEKEGGPRGEGEVPPSPPGGGAGGMAYRDYPPRPPQNKAERWMARAAMNQPPVEILSLLALLVQKVQILTLYASRMWVRARQVLLLSSTIRRGTPACVRVGGVVGVGGG
jgi:hypothetical protein